MRKIRCILADDEQLSLEIMEKYVSKLDNYQVVNTCKNGVEVFNILKAEPIDLLFLDIQMPQLTGLELLKSLKKIPPTIFTTAFREYAMDGYELNVIDYLLKPISFERFLKAVDKFESMTLPSHISRLPEQEVLSGVTAPFIYVKSAKKTVKVFLKDIIYLEGAKDVIRIITVHGEVVTYQALQDFEKQLPDEAFLRIHRSYIIAIDRIRAYNASHIEIGDTELPIGHSYQRVVKNVLNA